MYRKRDRERRERAYRIYISLPLSMPKYGCQTTSSTFDIGIAYVARIPNGDAEHGTLGLRELLKARDN